jgi:hypothetical protein
MVLPRQKPIPDIELAHALVKYALRIIRSAAPVIRFRSGLPSGLRSELTL